MRVSAYIRCRLLLSLVLLTYGARAQTWLGAAGTSTGTVGTTTNFADIQQTVTDAAGNVYVAGRYAGTVQLGTITLTNPWPNDVNAFVAKLSPAGGWLWATATQATSSGMPVLGSCAATGVALAPGGDVVVTGNLTRDTNFGSTTLLGPSRFVDFKSNVFVAQLSPAGAWRWATSAHTPGHVGQLTSMGGTAGGVAVAPSGEVLVTGTFADTLVFGSTVITTVGRHREAFVGRLSATGTWQWAVATTGSTGRGGLGPPLLTRGLLVSTDAAGNAFLTGSFARAITFGATTLTRTDTTGLDHYVARISPTGAWQWATHTDRRGAPFALTLFHQLTDAAGNLLLTGALTDTVTFGATTLVGPPDGGRAFVASVSPTGAWGWATASDGGGSSQARDGGVALALDASGNILLAGYTSGAASGAPTTNLPLVVKISLTGVWGWRAMGSVHTARQFGLGMGVGVAPGGDVQVVGVFRGTLTLGATSLTSTDSMSVFVGTLTNGPLATPSLLATAPPLSVWPNPARLTVTIRPANPEPVEVVDALGRVVRTYTRVRAAEVAADRLLDLRGLPTGLYTVRVGAAARRLAVE